MDKLCVHTSLVLSATEIGAILLCSKKFCKAWATWNGIRKRGIHTVITSQSFFSLSAQVKSSFVVPFLVVSDVFDIYFGCSWHHFTSFWTASAVLFQCWTCGKIFLENYAGCMDGSLRSNNISELNLSTKCEHSLKECLYIPPKHEFCHKSIPQY